MHKINLWLLVICTCFLLSACEKKYSVDDFKSNKQFLSGCFSKCSFQKKDNDFWNFQHAYKAEYIVAFINARDEAFDSVINYILSTEVRAQGEVGK
ncbi:MAG: EexN family lipoprotein [Bombilactobacillus sp.]